MVLYQVAFHLLLFYLYHDGERLASDEYIRKNAQITAEIDPIYELLPEPEPEPESRDPLHGTGNCVSDA